MIRALMGLTIVAATVVAGCESSGSSSSNGRHYKPSVQNTNLAAYAASAQYPKDKTPLMGQPVTATINKNNGKITIRNFTDKTMFEPRLWVNSVYVLRLRTVGPQSVITVDRKDIFNSSGTSLATEPVDAINKVELETEQNLIQVQGPQFE